MMSCQVYRSLLVAFWAVTLAVAQDPTKVEPKHYRLGFENQHVQVVYVHYGPHEESTIHDHPAGVVVNITGGHLRFIDEAGNVQDVHANAGEARWFPPHKHRVENLGDTPYNAVYIGIREPGGKAASQGSPLQDEEVKAILAAYRLAAPK
jgi:quercetin dioxygenase-like cupin family protein